MNNVKNIWKPFCGYQTRDFLGMIYIYILLYIIN